MGLNEKFFASAAAGVPVANLKLHLDASDTNSYSGTGSTWFDLTANNEDGTISGATWNNGGYFSFDGSNDYVQISPIPSTVQTDAIITAEAWINPISATNNSIISFRGAGGSSVKFFFAATNQGKLYLVSSFNTTVLFGTTASNTVPVNSWSHVVASINYTTQQYYIYVNGVEKTSGSTGTLRGASTFGATSFFIGANLSNVQNSNLNISKVRIYDIALTSTEIETLHNEGR
tara:strand:- start:63 stop:758 length:696 start_codon:yes stop_codon:yes gene_type:complete